MALIRKRKATVPESKHVVVEKKTTQKKLPKDQPQEPPLLAVELPKQETPKPEPVVVESDKGRYWEGIGVVGTNDIVNTFRATVKYRKDKVGKLLCDFMKEYNEKNKI